MKTIRIFLLAILSCAGFALRAQTVIDTIDIHYGDSVCLNPYAIWYEPSGDTTYRKVKIAATTRSDEVYYLYDRTNYHIDTVLEAIYYCYDQEPVTVYGIACCYFYSFYDNNRDSFYLYQDTVGIFQNSKDSTYLQLMTTVPINPSTPIIQYLRFINLNITAPLQAAYFDSAITITDTLFIYPGIYIKKSMYFHRIFWPYHLYIDRGPHYWNGIDTTVRNFLLDSTLKIKSTYILEKQVDSVTKYHALSVDEMPPVFFHPLTEILYPLLVPILTPPDTTTSTEDSTTAAIEGRESNGMGAFVTVQPSVATDRARVLSSFGLTHVEACDASGRQVYSQPAQGLSHTIDIASWPRGLYLLRITTPFGSTTKKLVAE